MLSSLFFWAGVFFLLGGFFFWKKKPVLGWLFMMISAMALAIGLIVFYLFPDRF